ncbi:alpha/beta fold hydrolase [Nocardia sp. NPDC005998]|uniref:thioesterase II family protein n=1 Tax=Nocardia sp. NPDC005998 TaxID=3156894 RepID=UPI0033AE6F0D
MAIVCFPHSGGSADSFRPLAACAPTGSQWWAVQYPGRGDRFLETPVARVDEIGRQVAAEVTRLAPEVGAVALFGHSLGALTAYETAVALTDSGLAPTYLFVSASPSPRHAGGGRVHSYDDERLWSAVCALGGIEPDLVDNEEFRDLMLPALRADITANETYCPPAPIAVLNCPIRCYYSPQDRMHQEEAMHAWASATTRGISVRARAGGHFHLFADPAEFVEDLIGSLTGVRS